MNIESKIKDINNVSNVRQRSREAVQSILTALKVADINNHKPSPVEFAKDIQAGKDYYSYFKDERGGTKGILSFYASLFVTILVIAAISMGHIFTIHLSFLDYKQNLFLSRFLDGFVILGFVALIHWPLDVERSETGYVKLLAGHLNETDKKYIEPIRQLLFDGIDAGGKPKKEVYLYKVVAFLVVLGALLNGLSAYFPKAFYGVAVIAFVLWFFEFNFKKIREEGNE